MGPNNNDCSGCDSNKFFDGGRCLNERPVYRGGGIDMTCSPHCTGCHRYDACYKCDRGWMLMGGECV